MREPGSSGRIRVSDLLLIAAINGALGLAVFGVLVVLFGIHGTLGGSTGVLNERWELMAAVPLTTAVAFAGLWMRLCTRPRELPIGSGGLYGIALVYGTFPLAGAAAGLVTGIGAERWVIYLVSLLVMPELLGALTVYGIVMGLVNAWAAYRWRVYYGK